MRNKTLKHYLFMVVLILVVNIGCTPNGIDTPFDNLVKDEVKDDQLDNGNDGENEDDKGEQEINSSLTAKVNGNDFKTTTVLQQYIAGASVSVNENFYGIGVIALDVKLDIRKPRSIYLFMYGEDFNALKAGTSFTTVTNIVIPENGGAFAIYSEDPDTKVEDDEISTEIVESISIKITALDKVNYLISGEFSYTAIDEDTNKKYIITDGKFEDMKYEN
ncbi:hypothetical protein [Kriegella aquimaris]|uniref:Uncharacterized protein n=1 Tax=Kriegella aquimaris TaxID=192904 RepID=A0A1G9WDM5_9FLAO|nr:hypothetical protein [Kriegella aquimaris]SDM82608.1 hypothetical protein SAMN04488514_11566 [Kriegella aquimaris]